MRIQNYLRFATVSSLLLLAIGCNQSHEKQSVQHIRPIVGIDAGDFKFNGISYSAYRDGESPGDGSLTSKENILEDLKILSNNFRFIRLYGSGKQARNILEVIQENKLPLKVMQGIWLDGRESFENNMKQVDGGIELARDFGDIIFAVNVGNEILVDWSVHRFADVPNVLPFVDKVRSAIAQPVTVSDDYNFWNKPESHLLAGHVDFICLHAYAFWNNQTIENAINWTQSIYKQISSEHPQHQIAFCESGWPTSRIYNDGSYEGGLIGIANKDNQQAFYKNYSGWVNRAAILSFYFSSFDEKWKGGYDGELPENKAEKHWGLYTSSRFSKGAL
jgi:exo-beta-1,3-glucanase (GH17 family)